MPSAVWEEAKRRRAEAEAEKARVEEEEREAERRENEKKERKELQKQRKLQVSQGFKEIFRKKNKSPKHLKDLFKPCIQLVTCSYRSNF